MQLVKSITLKKIKTLHCFSLTLLVLISAVFTPVFGQDNSPYSRYGIGDLVPSTNISSRAMGGISAGYVDFIPLYGRTINFSNPASYSAFEASKEERTKKLSSGRVILDVGINMESRTLKESNPSKKFTANNLLFSYVQVGVPLRKGWGLSFGIRPVSRISYKVFRGERLKDPITGNPIDSVTTRFEGDGGSYLVSAGTGIMIFKKIICDKFEESLSFGFNVGYLFGRKNNSSKREFRNDTVQYFSGNFQTLTNYGSIYLNAGLQYRLPLDCGKKAFTAGIYGNMSHKMDASQDRIRETFIYDPTLGDLALDSVSYVKDIKGQLILPASITAGVVYQKFPEPKKSSGWMIGLDFMFQNWDKYRFYGQADSLRNKWELRIGGQINPVPRENYFSKVAIRGGFIFGPDYINVQNKLPQLGMSFGLGLPIANYNRLSQNQYSLLNLSFEFIKRGNNDNLLKENLFRLSAGFAFSDFWFIKRKYD